MAGLTTAEKVARGAKRISWIALLVWLFSWAYFWPVLFVDNPVANGIFFVLMSLSLRVAFLSCIVYAVAQWRLGKQAGTQLARPETAAQQIVQWSKMVSRSALLVVAISAVPYLLLFEAAQGAGVDAEEGVASAGLVIMALLVLGILSLVVYFIARAKASGQRAGLITAEKIARWAGRLSVAAFLVWILSWWYLWPVLFMTEPGAEEVRNIFLFYSLHVGVLFFVVYVVARVRADKQARRQAGK